MLIFYCLDLYISKIYINATITKINLCVVAGTLKELKILANRTVATPKTNSDNAKLFAKLSKNDTSFKIPHPILKLI
ncbi:MAG: hypothetical protein K0S51_286 [Bacillales bacterium]|nr:hypothetical protein [Bacillales bacterium]